jgi:hypothetical protein
MVRMKATLVGGLAVFILAMFASAAQADTSIQVWPSDPNVVGRGQVALHIVNNGDAAWVATVQTTAKWLVPEVGSIALAPGQTERVVVHVRKDEPKGQQQVAFIIPAPAGSGIEASGGVAVAFNYEPETATPQAPPPVTASGEASPWWLLAMLPLVAVGIFMMSRRGRKRPRAVGF